MIKTLAILFIAVSSAAAEVAYGHPGAYGHGYAPYAPLVHGGAYAPFGLAHGHGAYAPHLGHSIGHGAYAPHLGHSIGHGAYAPHGHAVPVLSAYSTLTKHLAPAYGLGHGHGYAGHLAPAHYAGHLSPYGSLAHGGHAAVVAAAPVAHVAKVEKTVVAPTAYAHPLAHGAALHGGHYLGGHVAAYPYGAYGPALAHAPAIGHLGYGHGFAHKSKA